MRRKLSTNVKRIGVAFFVLVLLMIGLSFYVGWALTHPKNMSVTTTPSSFGILNYEDISFTSAQDKLILKGWFLPSSGSTRTIIFAHGYKQNRIYERGRRWKLNLAKKLVENGFNVLLFDFRNCGQSQGELTSIGQFEKRDILGAIDYIKSRDDEGKHVALLGFSMGAATCALATAERPDVEAVVMDSSFADLRRYLEKNLSVWSHLPEFPFSWLILNLAPKLLDINPSSVSPISVVPKIKTPIFFIHGEKDTKIPSVETLQLFHASDNPEDKIWVVPKAGHVEAFETYPDKYTDYLLKFLFSCMKS